MVSVHCHHVDRFRAGGQYLPRYFRQAQVEEEEQEPQLWCCGWKTTVITISIISVVILILVVILVLVLTKNECNGGCHLEAEGNTCSWSDGQPICTCDNADYHLDDSPKSACISVDECFYSMKRSCLHDKDVDNVCYLLRNSYRCLCAEGGYKPTKDSKGCLEALARSLPNLSRPTVFESFTTVAVTSIQSESTWKTKSKLNSRPPASLTAFERLTTRTETPIEIVLLSRTKSTANPVHISNKAFPTLSTSFDSFTTATSASANSRNILKTKSPANYRRLLHRTFPTSSASLESVTTTSVTAVNNGNASKTA